MKKAFIFLALNAITFAVKAQTDSSVVTIHYDFVQVVDTTQRDSPKKDDMILYLGKTASLFTSYTNMQTEERIKEFMRKHPGDFGGNTTINYGAPYVFYKNNKANKLVSLAQFKGTTYLIPETTPTQDWKMTTETKTIQSYNCQKATTVFRGRTYEAWFCSDLPYQSGPWKLGGLPGLILEASDSKKEVVFTFKSFDENAPHTTIVAPGPGVTTSTKSLAMAIEAAQNVPAAKPGEGTIIVGQLVNGVPAKRKEYNNPIEKEKK